MILLTRAAIIMPTPDRRSRRPHRPSGQPSTAWRSWLRPAVFATLAVLAGCASINLYTDDFRGHLGPGWTILREDPAAWRATPEGLEIRVLPGNMWGPANDAKNTFVRAVPDPAQGPVTVTVRVENRPTEQYGQVDLVWYYADSHQVKIGQEQVDGKLTIVMGREEGDRTRTIAIIPLESTVVDLRLEARGSLIHGSFRTPSVEDWREAGSCELPIQGAPKVSLQAYQGPAQAERWARLSHFEVRQPRK
jgi:regulation of enolase protein 1 (concanavalin A-like superfamily)